MNVIPTPRELPFDLRLKNLDQRVWLVLASFAGNATAAFLIPPVREMSRVLKIDVHQLLASYQRLHDTQWITLQRIGKPGRQRMRVVLRVPEPAIVWRDQVHEGVEADATLRNMYHQGSDKPVAFPDGVEAPHEPQYQFPQHLQQLVRTINLKDQAGRPIIVPNAATLYEFSGRAGEGDLRAALMRLVKYRTPVTDLLALWSSFFTEGKFIMKHIKYQRHTATRLDLPESSRVEQFLSAKELANGRQVEIGRLHPVLSRYLTRFGLLERRGPHVSLRFGYTLTITGTQEQWAFEIETVPEDTSQESPP